MSQLINDGFAQFTASGGELNVPWDFKIADRREIQISRIRAGVTTTLVLDTDYTIASNQLNVDLGGVAILIGSATPALTGDIYTALLVTPYSRGTLDGSSDFSQAGDLFASVVNTQFDYIVRMIQRVARDGGRALRAPDTDSLNASLILQSETARAGKVPYFDAQGSVQTTVFTDSVSAAAAAASASTAQAQAVIATNQAAIATSAVAGIPYRDVVFLTFANSPYTMTNADRGKLFSIDTSGGSFVFNLAAISSLTLPFTIGVKKATSDGNGVTVNRGGTDTIDIATTSYLITNVGGANFVADTDTTPDRWLTASFGTQGGTTNNQAFVATTDFTPGVTTTLTLTNTPIAPSSTSASVYFDGILQQPSQWVYNPTTGVFTFSSAIPLGVAEIFVSWASTTIAIGTPSNGTVTFASLASALLATTAEIISGTASKLVTAAGLAPLLYGCSVYQTTGTSVPNATWTTLGFDTEEYDDNTWHDNVTNNSRITVNFTGRLLLTGRYMPNTAANMITGIRVNKNASTILETVKANAASGTNNGNDVSIIIPVTINDFLELQGYQASGGSLTSLTGTLGCAFKVQRIK